MEEQDKVVYIPPTTNGWDLQQNEAIELRFD
jgi:hypothetical protein